MVSDFETLKVIIFTSPTQGAYDRLFLIFFLIKFTLDTNLNGKKMRNILNIKYKNTQKLNFAI